MALKYTVCVNDDVFTFETDRRMRTEEIAEYLECDVEEIVQIDVEDAE